MSELEQRVVRALERLERDWPEGLTLASMGGALHLLRTEEMVADNFGSLTRPGINPDASIWSSSRIPNTGGDW